MDNLLLEGNPKKQYLDDFIAAIDTISQRKILPGKLESIRSIAQRMHYQKCITLNPNSGLASKADLLNLKKGLPYEEELGIGTRIINGHIDLFDYPISEGVWIRYIIGLHKKPKPKININNLDHSHLRDPEQAYHYLLEHNIQSSRIEQHILGPFITDHLQADYGLMSDMVKNHRGSWVLVYKGKTLTAKENGFFSKPKINVESQMYFACSDSMKKDLHILYPKKEILTEES